MLSPITARIQLTYRPDLHLLTGRWLTEATLVEFQAEYEAVLAAARAHQAWHWLLDVRRRPLPPAGAVEWLNSQFMPAAATAAPQLLRIAYLVSPQRLQAVAADERLQAAVAELNATRAISDVRMFIGEGDAVHWLTGH